MLLVLLSVALADLAPPPGLPNPPETCTVETHAIDGKECKSCDAYYGGREPCEALEKEGYVKVCRTRGASTWDEILCKNTDSSQVEGEEPAEKPVEPVPASEPEPKGGGAEKRRCDVTGFGATTMLAVIPLTLVRRRE